MSELKNYYLGREIDDPEGDVPADHYYLQLKAASFRIDGEWVIFQDEDGADFYAERKVVIVQDEGRRDYITGP
jgi:hypothetical protein